MHSNTIQAKRCEESIGKTHIFADNFSYITKYICAVPCNAIGKLNLVSFFVPAYILYSLKPRAKYGNCTENLNDDFFSSKILNRSYERKESAAEKGTTEHAVVLSTEFLIYVNSME